MRNEIGPARRCFWEVGKKPLGRGAEGKQGGEGPPKMARGVLSVSIRTSQPSTFKANTLAKYRIFFIPTFGIARAFKKNNLGDLSGPKKP